MGHLSKQPFPVQRFGKFELDLRIVNSKLKGYYDNLWLRQQLGFSWTQKSWLAVETLRDFLG